MKIIRERSYINPIGGLTKTGPRSAAGSAAKTNAKNFDAITISSKEPMDETTFAKEISKKIMKEASAPNHSQKIDELKAQVQSGSYQIMIDEIAKKMLLS